MEHEGNSPCLLAQEYLTIVVSGAKAASRRGLRAWQRFYSVTHVHDRFPGGASGIESACQLGDARDPGSGAGSGDPWSRRWRSAGVFSETVKKRVKLFGAAFLK